MEAYKYEKILIYNEKIKKYESDIPEDLASDLLGDLGISFYDIEKVEANPIEGNNNPHLIIEYTIKIK